MGKWLEVGCFVGRWYVDSIKPRKNVFGVMISPVRFGLGLFCYSNFDFFYIDDT